MCSTTSSSDEADNCLIISPTKPRMKCEPSHSSSPGDSSPEEIIKKEIPNVNDSDSNNSNTVIFRSTINLPITYILPRKHSTDIIFIAYTDCDPGHYDSALYVGTAAMKQV